MGFVLRGERPFLACCTIMADLLTISQLTPACPDAKLNKGYLSLPADWLSKNPKFKLSVPIAPRLIASHPFTNQNTLSVARGPVVYCAEDYDNDWVEDHFKVRHTHVSPRTHLSIPPLTRFRRSH